MTKEKKVLEELKELIDYTITSEEWFLRWFNEDLKDGVYLITDKRQKRYFLFTYSNDNKKLNHNIDNLLKKYTLDQLKTMLYKKKIELL